MLRQQRSRLCLRSNSKEEAKNEEESKEEAQGTFRQQRSRICLMSRSREEALEQAKTFRSCPRWRSRSKEEAQGRDVNRGLFGVDGHQSFPPTFVLRRGIAGSRHLNL